MAIVTNAFDVLRARALDIVAAQDLGLRPVTGGGALEELVGAETERFQRELMRGEHPGLEPFVDPLAVLSRVMSELSGLGAGLDVLVEDPGVEEVFGRDSQLVVRREGGGTRYLDVPGGAAAAAAAVGRMVASANENLDAAHPKVDGIRVVLPGGRVARLSASVPPRVEGTVSFTLRLPKRRNTTLADLVELGSLSPEAAAFLELLMRARRTRLLVAGPPGAGKTTLLEALLRAVPADRRVVCAEEQRELSAPLLNGEYWQSSKVESLTDLIRSARVASPDLVVLGELKGSEAWELLMAGALGTGVVAAVHAEDAPGAFEALAVCATRAVPATPFIELGARFAAMFDVVVYCDMDTGNGGARRQVTEISVVPPQLSLAGTGVAVTPVFRREDVGEVMELRTAAVGGTLERRCNRELRRYGMSLPELLQGAEVPW